MDRFDWKAGLEADIYNAFPEAERQPVIGITGNYGEQTCKLAETYYKSVAATGGTPVIIPPLESKEAIINTLDRIDALILSGGGDYNPLYCGEEPEPGLNSINTERDLPELLITRLAYNRQIPMLGICRGIQTMAMALDGKVIQDIGKDGRIKHSQDADRRTPTHMVELEKDSIIYTLYNNRELLAVNSFHHQALAEPGPHFRVTARAKDGVIEAVESTEHKPIMGVQWHPECMESGTPLFRWMVAEARKFRKAHDLHDKILSLDSHCDTPMMFHKGVDIGNRDDRILVDLHKMQEGRLDASIMVAYLPQPKSGEDFCKLVKTDVKGPKEYADRVFERIEEFAQANSNVMGLARTRGELMANKLAGRKSIMLGIENGIALEGNIDYLRHFAERGIVYMTLCHNGDNDICDSARGEGRHGGVSKWGEEVIREMNRLGVLVDMSHAAESSFYDAIEISNSPIVCSHSSCRALCDHPRNLTDEQMRRLAANGGVMQITLYNGFLRTDGMATIRDAMEHLDHAVRVMGIDHVGLGTDFDGDGGITGLANAAELINFTKALMERRYSNEDIEKIWGGNFMRGLKD